MPWSPENKYIWDFWFASKGEEVHLFYLQASRAECNYNPDLRHNLASVGHAVLTRWGWKEAKEATAFSKAEGDAWDNLSIWTGSIIQPDRRGPYFMFYTSRRKEDEPVWTPHEWQRPQYIGLALSDDLFRWRRAQESASKPLISNPGSRSELDGVSWRDPYAVESDGDYRIFICARLRNADKKIDSGGAIAYLESRDLRQWDASKTRLLVKSDEFYQMETPQVFWRQTGDQKRFYLLFSAQQKDCSRKRRETAPMEECQTGSYYMASEPLPLTYKGIPELKGAARLLAANLYAGKLLNPDSQIAPVFFGFQWSDESGRFEGGLSDPRRVLFNADGSIELTDEH